MSTFRRSASQRGRKHLLLCALLTTPALFACKKITPPREKPPQVSAPTSPIQITSPSLISPEITPPPRPAEVALALTRVPQKELPGLPTRFDRSGRFMAVLQQESSPPTCMLWDLRALVYVGQVDKDRCTTSDWIVPGSVSLPNDLDDPLVEDTPRSSADGKQRARFLWKESKLVIEREGTTVQVRAGCARGHCPDVIATAFSPDGKYLALTRARGTQIFIVDTQSGKTALTLKLQRSELPLPKLLTWGPAGLAAYLGQRDGISDEKEEPAPPPQVPDLGEAAEEDPPADDATPPVEIKKDPPRPAPSDATNTEKDSGKINGAHLSVWRTLGSRAQRRDFFQEYNDQGLEARITFDPHGRYLFELLSTPHDGIYLAMWDIAANRKTALGWHHLDADKKPCESSERLSAAWIPGKWPIYETVEERDSTCAQPFLTYRLQTAPGLRQLVTIPLKKKPPEGEMRTVKDDGKTLQLLRGKAARDAWLVPAGDVDADKRWEATSKNSLRRLSDQEELIFEPSGCVHTAEWVYDCPLSTFAEQVFLLDSDPLKAFVVRGVQVAHLFHHPNLRDDFFDGKSAAPAAGSKSRVGLPPRLDKLEIKYPEPGSQTLAVTVVAHDGGDGVGPVRVWVDGAPLSIPPTQGALALTLEKPTTLTLPLSEKLCGHVLITACNQAGLICGAPLDIPYCPSKKHHIK